MGGEEFCFLLPDCGLSEALAVAERIRTAFAALAIYAGYQALKLSGLT